MTAIEGPAAAAEVVGPVEAAGIGRFIMPLRAGAAAASADQGCAKTGDCCVTVSYDSKDQDVAKVAVDVPEIGTQEVAGEWLIQPGEVLLVSFGAYTAANADGKAVVKERLAMIEAEAVAALAVPFPPRPAAMLPVPVPNVSAMPRLPLEPPPAVPPAAAMPMPVVPSRTIPQGVHADGTAAELPPLPADEMEDDPSTESSEPRPSPQMKRPQQAKPATDSGANRGVQRTQVVNRVPAKLVHAQPIGRLSVPAADQTPVVPAAAGPEARDRNLRPSRSQHGRTGHREARR